MTRRTSATALVIVLLVFGILNLDGDQGASGEMRRIGPVGEFDPEHNPMADGDEVDFREAAHRTPWRMPPFDDDRLGYPVGIWFEAADASLAMTWTSNLRMYVEKLPGDVSEEAIVGAWRHKAQKRHDPSGSDSVLVEVQGRLGLATDHDEGSSLTFLGEDGLVISMVAEEHTTAELQDIAADITYET